MGITNVPNQGVWKTRDGKENNGYLPMTRTAGNVRPSNDSTLRDGDAGGSANLAKNASPVNPPNDSTFRGGDKGTSGPASANPSAVMPGQGAVPVNPFLVSGGLVPSRPIADEATKRMIRR
jgi:hypothetical protein